MLYFLPVALIAVSLLGCSSSPVAESRVNAPLVEDQYRLSADREAFEKIREQVPEEKRKENDEIAFLEQLMADTKTPPSQVREKFNSALAKKRTAFNKDLEKRRTDFVRQERTEREAFQREQDSRRSELRSKKTSADERREAYSDLDLKRKDFYSAQRERRDAFESDIKDRRKNFEDYARQTSADFNQEHRNYMRRYDEAQKARKEQTKKAVDDFKKMDQVPSRPLEAGQSEN